MWQFTAQSRIMAVGIGLDVEPPADVILSTPALTTGVQFYVEYANNVRDVGHVIEVHGNEATFELKDTSKWRMEMNSDGSWIVSEKIDG